MSKQRKFCESSNKLKTLDLVLIIIGAFLGLFIITMVVLFCIYQQIPDTLVTCVLGSSSLELFFSAWITVVKKKTGITDNNDEL